MSVNPWPENSRWQWGDVKSGWWMWFLQQQVHQQKSPRHGFCSPLSLTTTSCWRWVSFFSHTWTFAQGRGETVGELCLTDGALWAFFFFFDIKCYTLKSGKEIKLLLLGSQTKGPGTTFCPLTPQILLWIIYIKMMLFFYHNNTLVGDFRTKELPKCLHCSTTQYYCYFRVEHQTTLGSFESQNPVLLSSPAARP